jgi:hypothetical protein
MLRKGFQKKIREKRRKIGKVLWYSEKEKNENKNQVKR